MIAEKLKHQGEAYAYCESTAAYRWHIRQLDDRGLMPNEIDGKPALSLCNMKMAWDIDVRIEPLLKTTCPLCAKRYTAKKGGSMRTLVIPDVHNKIHTADSIIDREEWDEVVLLGDYFDDFDDSLDEAEETADWLIKQSRMPNRICLIGNHDMPYAFPRQGFECSGWNFMKQAVINNVMGKREWSRLLPVYPVDKKYLLSHAGIHPSHVQVTGDSREIIIETILQAYDRVWSESTEEELFRAGRSRGGTQKYGGITWLDWSEFEEIPGIPQVVGHTAGGNWRSTGEGNYCLDTHLQHYAIIEDDVVTVKNRVGEEQ